MKINLILYIMDLFEDYKNLPIEVQNLLSGFDNSGDTYENCSLLVAELEKVGYTCEYDLAGDLVNLQKL